jgi:hypothetical protein
MVLSEFGGRSLIPIASLPLSKSGRNITAGNILPEFGKSIADISASESASPLCAQL